MEKVLIIKRGYRRGFRIMLKIIKAIVCKPSRLSFNSPQLHHLHFERNTLSFFKNPVEALSLRSFALFRCCLRPKKAPCKILFGAVFTLHSPKLVDSRVASQQVGPLKNQQLTHSQKEPFFLTPRLGELSNKNNSKRLSANSCWFGRCLGEI